ncbi:MmgE/PrpD family protein [Sporomusa aerivorans]|uniref:MmgE/PrpD family protein n=1 Tax=Sporomusa aerivorans TaxID=204936 RepID=UPI00352AC9CE
MNNRQADLQAGVAEFISELKFTDLPAEIVADTKYRILDWIGCALAGIRTQPSRIAAAMAGANGGKEQASILRAGIKVPLAQAAWVNALTGHVVEFDDGHRQAIAHPGSVTVPVALAVAEGFSKSGKEIITAIVAGYEVLIRLGIAVNPSHYKVWHTTATCGTFAAAAVAANLLNFDKNKTQTALGIAGTMSAGLQETFGTYAKPLNVGHACQSGIQAVLLSDGGFTGPEDIIAGKKGFIVATSSDQEIRYLEQIRNKEFMSNTAFYKMYSSCGHTHSPLDAIFSIMREQEISVEQIQAVEIATYRISVELTAQLKNGSDDEAKFSLPYCIACALLFHKVTLDEFTADILIDPRVIELARKIQVFEDPAATQAFPKRFAKVTITMQDGRRIDKQVTAANDIPQYDSLEQKFISLAVPGVDQQTAQEIKQLVLKMDELEDVSALIKYLQ